MDEQERLQYRSIRALLNSDGWTYLLAAWSQLREEKIIGKLKQSKNESHWRFHQGRLEGFDEAVTLAEKLALMGGDMNEASEKEANEILNNIGGNHNG